MTLNKVNYKVLLKPILTSAIITLAIFIAIATLLFFYNRSVYYKNIEQQQRIETQAIESILAEYINTLKNDTLILANSHLVSEYSITPNKTTSAQLFEAIQHIMLRKKYYYQFRLLNLSGKEIFRINYKDDKVHLVDNDTLQDKSKRYYFKEAKALKKDQVSISNYDYNIENGKLEYPARPTLRLITPIHVKNIKFGYLVINFNDKALMNKLELFKNITGFEVYIVNTNKQFVCFKTSANALDDIPKKYKQHKNFINKVFSKNKYFLLFDAYFYKTKIHLNTGLNKNSSNSFVYLIIENPGINYQAFLRNNIYNIALYGSIFYILTLTIIYLFIFSFFIISKGAIQFRKIIKLIELSGEGVVITDSNRVIIYVNQAFLDIFKCNIKEAIGFNISKFKSSYHDYDFFSSMEIRIRENGKWEGDIVDILPDKTRLIKHLKIEKIVDKKNGEINYIGTYRDITRLRESLTTISKLKYLDHLTTLPNKKAVHNYLTQKIRNHTETNSKFCISSICINNLKEINNTYGFNIADKIILLFVERLKEKLGEDIFLGRIGENQFFVSSYYCSFENYDSKISSTLGNCSKIPYSLEGYEIYTSLNVGISIFPDNGRDADTLMQTANMATHNTEKYDNINIGFYSENLLEKIKEKAHMLSLLKNAVSNNELSLNYQPKVDSRTNMLVGAEALIRWHNPELGNIPPNIFIPLAEDNELINEISSWVVKELCRQILEWQKTNIQLKPISFNLSPYDFEIKGFFANFFSLISKYGLTGNEIEVEITEGVLVRKIDHVIDKIDKLKKNGFKILIDDFGTGYSSLNYLKRFNIDIIKIDRSFIKDYPENSDGEIAKTIINLAKSLNMGVICEGAETKVQIDFLSSLGCDIIQGYYYSKPLKAYEFEILLKQKNIRPMSKQI